MLWQSELVAQVSSCIGYSFLAATNSPAQPFYSESSHTHFHWLSLHFPLTFSLLRWLFLLKCTPCGKTTTWDAIAQLRHSACFGHVAYFFSPTSGALMSFTSLLERRTFISLRKIACLGSLGVDYSDQFLSSQEPLNLKMKYDKLWTLLASV